MSEGTEGAQSEAQKATRTTAAWLGIDEHELAVAPPWLLEVIAARLAERDPEVDLRSELIGRMHESLEILHRLATTDELTGMANRRALIERLGDEVARAKRYQRNLAVFVLDIDDMKRVNDNFGHPAGDQLLIEVGRRIERTIRATDLAGRWGGDEFVIICPETDGGSARALSEKLTTAIAARPVAVGERGTRVGVSVGFAIDGTTGDTESLLAAADASLYAVKQRHGRLGVPRAVSASPG